MKAFALDSVAANLSGYDSNIAYLNNSHESWVIHAPGFISLDTSSFDELWNLHPTDRKSIIIGGRSVKLPRFVENYGIDYKFSHTMFPGREPPPILESILEKLRPLVSNNAHQSLLNNCLMNWYESGNHYIGLHSDNEPELYPHSPILTLSLGATRTFRLAPKSNMRNRQQHCLDVEVAHGDLLIMGGTTQTTHLHSVTKTLRCPNPRISVTMRCMRVY